MKNKSSEKIVIKNLISKIGLTHNRSECMQNELSTSETESVAKSYIKGQVCLHLHIRHKALKHDLRDLCIVYESGVKNQINVIRNMRVRKPQDATEWLRDRKRKELVFITNIEYVERPQKVPMRVPTRIPTSIRLHFLDECLSRSREALDPVFVSPEGFYGIADWKHRSGVSRIATSKFPRDVVINASQVVNAVADNERPFCFRDLERIAEAYNIATMFRVRFDGDRVWVSRKKISHCFFESIEVMLCPTSFGSTSCKAWPIVRHKKGLHNGEQTEDTQRRRNPHPEAWRLLQEYEESRHAIIDPPPKEVASAETPVRRRGDCTATHTHRGSVEDAS